MSLSQLIQCLPLIFFPLLSDEKYKLNKTCIGTVISLASLGGILLSIFYQKISRKFNIIQYNILLQASIITCCVVFGLASLFDNKWIFLFLSGIARLFSGMAVGGIGIISYEYIILIEPENMKQNIALTEMVSVVGFCVGSPFSYYLYEYLGGYVNMFLCTSFILTLNAFQFFYFFQKFKLFQYIQLQHKINDKDYKNNQLQFQDQQNIYQIVLNNKQLLITFIIIMGISLCDLFVISGISVYQKNVFGYRNFEISIFYLLTGLGYMIVTILFYQKNIQIQNTKKCIFYSYIISTGLTFFLCWQKELGLPFIFYQPFIVSLILGSAMMIGCIQSVPEFISLMNDFDDSLSKQAYYTEMGSLLYVFSYQIGGFVGSMLGGIFFDIFGFTRGVNIFILLSFIFIAIPYFLIFNQYFILFNNNLDNYTSIDNHTNLLQKNTQTQNNYIKTQNNYNNI